MNSKIGTDHSEEQGKEKHSNWFSWKEAKLDCIFKNIDFQFWITQNAEINPIDLNLSTDQGENNGLQNDPHAFECLGDWIMISPAFSSPLHSSHKSHDDCCKTSSSIVVDQMGSKKSDQTSTWKLDDWSKF